MKICIFGSSFNPPHIAHQEIVLGLKKINFDKLIIVPTGNPNHKKIDISLEDRLNMVQIFAKTNEVDVSLHEVENQFAYTYESLQYLNFDNSVEIYFTIGGDSVNDLEKWDYFEKLKEMVTFVIVNRSGYELNAEILNKINYIMLDTKTTEVSSSELRANLNKELLQPEIYEYIINHKLYSSEVKNV